MSTRVARFEVGRITGDAKSAFARWFALSDQCQEITNAYWQKWLLWHVRNGSRQKIIEGFATYKAWEAADKSTRGPKPKDSLFALSKELSNELYHEIAAEFPGVNARVQVLLANITSKKIKERKAANGNLAGWKAILLYRESLPSSTRSQPIPFDKDNCKIEPPAERDGDYRLRLRVDRIDRGAKTAASHEDEVILLTRGRRMASQREIIKRCATGEYKFCGSQLQWSQARRKWFALICWQRVEDATSTQDKALRSTGTAFIRPQYNHPWSLRIAGRSRWVLGYGQFVGNERRQLLSQRWSRQGKYHHAGTSAKGHGRNRALSWLWKLQQRWKDLVKRTNHTATTRVVDSCVAAGVARLIYFQPKKDSDRFLANAGKHERDDASGWDWSQVATMLAYKCKDAGIHLEVHKASERKLVEA